MARRNPIRLDQIIPGDEVARRRTEPISERVRQGIEYVAQVVPESCDWLDVKKRLLIELPVCDRQLFTTRDPKTKKHHPFNVFENRVREAWRELTGNVLQMPLDKRLVDSDEAYL